MATTNKYLFLLAAIVLGLGLLSASASAWNFNATIKFPNGTVANGTNVTVYLYTNTTNIGNTINMSWTNYTSEYNGGGYVLIQGLNDTNGSTSEIMFYKISIIHASGLGESNYWGVQSSNYTGPILPAMPKNKIISALSGATIYLTPATNFNVSAYPYVFGDNFTFFRGAIFDTKYGFPVTTFDAAENPGALKNSSWAVLPNNRNYTLLLWTTGSLNDTVPPKSWKFVPPVTYQFTTNSSDPVWGSYVDVKKNMSALTLYNLSGHLMYPSGSNTSDINYTNILVYPFVSSLNMTLLDWAMGNVTGYDFNLNLTNLTRGSSWYNITLVGGMSYLIGGFGTSSATNATGYGGWRIITVSGNLDGFDINLDTLAGSYTPNSTRGGRGLTTLSEAPGTDALASKKTVFCFTDGDDSNKTVEEQIRAEVKTVYNTTELRWMAVSNVTGCFAMPLWDGVGVTVKVFGGRFAPKEYAITSTDIDAAQRINISLNAYNPINPASAVKYSAAIAEILGSNTSCDIPSPAASCTESTHVASALKPLNITYGGKNVSVRLSYYGIIVHFKNADLASAAVPDAEFEISATDVASGTTIDKSWKIGSKASSNTYSSVLVGLPYDDTQIDEDTIRLRISKLYDDSWTQIWDYATNGIAEVAVYPEYNDYNTSWFGETGILCQKNDPSLINTTQSCYVNTTSNYVWMYLPHFSGIEATIHANKLTTTAAATTGGSSGGGGGSGGAAGASSTYWSEVSADSSTTMTIYGSSSPVAMVDFTLSEDATAVKMIVTPLAGIPTVITTAPEGTPYKYFDVSATNVADTKIASASITFRVEKAWVTENNVDVATIKLGRFNNGAWQILKTVQAEEDATYYHFKAATPGFSTFVVLATTLSGQSVTTPVSTGTGTTTPETTTPELVTQPASEISKQMQKPANIGLLAALIAVIALIGYVMMKKPSKARRKGKTE